MENYQPLNEKPLIIGKDEGTNKVREMITLVAKHGINVLISGETGVGKELVAQNIYYESSRAGKPFIKINCAALPEGLLESELFGYERGAFTGAERRNRGKFQLAHNGVLFLDEIGEMPLQLQSKLLHVLQDGEFTPLGSENSIKTNAWIIAATNCDVKKAIQNKEFREDLYYRLNIIRIEIPPLRERHEDIPLLIDHFIEKYCSNLKGRSVSKPSERIIEKMLAYHWPGNVRQLQNVILKTIVLGNWEEALSELSEENDIHNAVTEAKEPIRARSPIVDLFRNLDLTMENLESLSLKKINKEIQRKVEKEMISYVLNKTGWNRKKASKILDISYRAILYKIKELKLENQVGDSILWDKEEHESAMIGRFPHG